jgi:GTP-binding protein EngB required for normal cell division
MENGHATGGTSELTQPIAEVCDRMLARLPAGAARDGIGAIHHRLVEEGLRIAVAGRVSSGKSTLVNALLRRRVAPTAAGECTRVVTWFRYGVPPHAEVVTRTGDTRQLPLIGGKLPESLSVSVDDVEAVVVHLPDNALKGMTLIDTPGLAAADERHSDSTRALLTMHDASVGALGEADALVFLISQTARQDDDQTLAAFAEATRGIETSAARTIGVLSMADKIAAGDMRRAQQLAETLAAELRPKVSTVIPCVALLAESAEVLTERDARNLKLLAETQREGREYVLTDVELFRDLASPVPAEDRERLLDLLDLFGIARCLELVRAGQNGASALARALRELSGVEALCGLIAETFEARADLLKAHAALSALDRTAWFTADDGQTADALRSLRNDVERLRLQPGMHRLRELWAVERAHARTRHTATIANGIPDGLKADLVRLTSVGRACRRLGLDETASDAELAAAALAGTQRWQEFKNGTMTLEDQQIAEVAIRSYTLLWSAVDRQHV